MADISKISPDNGTTIYDLKDIEARKRVPEVLLKDTVGWTGKNLLDIKHGTSTAQVHYSNDKVIVTGGVYSNFLTPTIKIKKAGTYTFATNITVTSGELNYAMLINGSQVTEVGVTESAFRNTDRALNAGDEVVFKLRSPNNGNGEFSNIMFYDASISDSTYEPYHESVESVLETKGDWDVRNLNPYPLGTRQLVGSDGTITDNSVMYLSDYIDVSEMSAVVWNGAVTGSVSFRIARYDSNKTFLDRSITNANTIFNLNGAKYIRVCFEDDGSNKITNGILQNALNEIKSYTEHREPLDEVIPSKMSYADNGILGAKNRFDFSQKTRISDAAISGTEDNFRITGSNVYRGFIFTASVEPNKEYRIKTNITVTSGTAIINVKNGADTQNIYTSAKITQSEDDVTFIFNSGNNTTILLRLFATFDVNENGDVTYEDFMLRLASDPDDTYVPYAMTNRELTEKKINLSDLKTVVSASSDFANFQTRIASL